MTNERLYELALHIKTNHKDNPWEGNSFQSSLDSIDRSIIDAVAAAVRAECHIDLEPFRAPVKYWRATAHLGELALDYRHRYLNSVEVYKARVAEADRLLAVIDAAVAQQEPTK